MVDLSSSGSLRGSKNQLVWYITGTSSGLGFRLVSILLERGDKVIAVSRSVITLEDFPKSENLRLQQLDITDGAAIVKRKVDEAIAWFGRIDVLVNNAGVNMKAFIEEGGSEQMRRQFDVNVFGTLDVTTAVLPQMRARRSGTIVMLGSRMSWKPEVPTVGMYSSSKAAIRIIGETLAVEVAPFGIRVLIVEPAGFRTEGILAAPIYAGNEFKDYDKPRKAIREVLKNPNSRLPGDPVKAMNVLADVVRDEGKAKGKPWPLYLPLGKEAEDAIREKSKIMRKVLDVWGAIIRDTRLDNP